LIGDANDPTNLIIQYKFDIFYPKNFFVDFYFMGFQRLTFALPDT